MPRYKNRVCTTNVVVSNEKGEILLVKRAAEPFKGWWSLPGGFMEWETAEDGARRELLEETGLLAGKMDFVGIFDAVNRSPAKNKPIAICFSTKLNGVPKAADDAEEIKFFPFDDLPPLAFDHAEMVKAYLGLQRS